MTMGVGKQPEVERMRVPHESVDGQELKDLIDSMRDHELPTIKRHVARRYGCKRAAVFSWLTGPSSAHLQGLRTESEILMRAIRALCGCPPHVVSSPW